MTERTNEPPIDWTKFPISITFDEPRKVTGRLVSVKAVKNAQGEPIPELTIRLDTGTLATIVAGQARLRSALAEAAPQPGQRIRITYHGTAAQSSPGMQPSKLFSVHVAQEQAQ